MMDPDGIAFLAIFLGLGLAFFAVAFLIEVARASAMRARRRHWRAMSRYVQSLSNGDRND